MVGDESLGAAQVCDDAKLGRNGDENWREN